VACAVREGLILSGREYDNPEEALEAARRPGQHPFDSSPGG
jgi:hypothetical protein